MNSRLYLFLKNAMLVVAVAPLFLLWCASGQAGELYKWVDENGKVSYQDQPPPVGAAVSQQVLKQPPAALSDAATGNGNGRQPATINPVVVYTVDACDACEILLLRLKQLGIPIREQSLLDREIQARVLSLTDSLTAPTLFIGDKLVQDTSESNLTSELVAAGYTLPDNSPDLIGDDAPQQSGDAEEIPQTATDE